MVIKNDKSSSLSRYNVYWPINQFYSRTFYLTAQSRQSCVAMQEHCHAWLTRLGDWAQLRIDRFKMNGNWKANMCNLYCKYIDYFLFFFTLWVSRKGQVDQEIGINLIYYFKLFGTRKITIHVDCGNQGCNLYMLFVPELIMCLCKW